MNDREIYKVIKEQFDKACREDLFAFLYESIYAALYACLYQGLLPPGTAIQENKLAQALNVSRTPLRHALAMLVEQGLLSFKAGSGMWVPGLDRADFMAANYARQALESTCAELAARNIGPEDLKALRRCIYKLKHFPTGDYQTAAREIAKLDFEFHERICLASGNRYLISAFKAIENQLFFMRYQYMFEQGASNFAIITTTVYDEHLTIYLALRNRNAALAYEAMRIHLNMVPTYIDQSQDERARGVSR